MKRKILIVLMAVCFAAISLGQRRNARNAVQKIIQLTQPKTTGKMSFEEALSKLRNTYRFTGQPLDRSLIGQLAWAGLGNRQPAPSGQAPPPQLLQSPFPTQLFIATNEGVFFYQSLNNSLEQIMEGDVRPTLAASTTMPDPVVSSGCVILITSSVTRNTGTRTAGTRRGSATTADSTKVAMLIEAGHIAQNIQLQAVSLDQNLSSTSMSNFDARAVARVCGLPRELEVLDIVCVGYLPDSGTPGSAVSKRALIIVPSANFEDKEFFDTYNALISASIQTVVASNRVGPIRGVNGGMFEVQVRLDTLRADNFDGIIVIGGPGAAVFINDPYITTLLNDAFAKTKIIGATSLGTSVLASTGILRSGIKVTGLPSDAINIAQTGAIFTTQLVENDQRVITCIGPQGSEKFGREIADAILGK